MQEGGDDREGDGRWGLGWGMGDSMSVAGEWEAGRQVGDDGPSVCLMSILAR